MSETGHVQAFLDAVDLSWAIASTPEVRAAWTHESSCAGMTVGGLTHHLLSQAGNTARGLRQGQGEAAPIAISEHYARAAWVRARPEDEVNVSIREGDNERAEAGPDAVLATARELIDALPALLAEPRDPDLIHIPWQGWSLTTADFLTTRMMEMVVHGDDLASSVGLPTPEYPEAAIEPVLALLTGVAARRHGQTAVVRALSRPQRAPASISAF
jgi:hypothetical protein